ncbi:MAG: cytochrome c [Trueperaceae bacterium]|nr:cytochrome c [Trueperaceae bacterium]
MPAWNQLDDEQLAATLNHTLYTLSDTTTPNDIPPITPNDIANQRDQNLTPQDQHDEREELLADTDEPAADEAQPDDAAADDEAEGEEPAPEGEGDAEAAADGENDAQAASWNETLGEDTYASNCASCHQANGQGIPGAFPPLAGHTSDLATRDGGRTYLTHVLLYGLQGPIDVQGTTYNGAMPAWNQLDDEQLAATLNHTLYTLSDTTTPNDIPPITPNDIANQRDQNLTPQDQHDEREELSLP